MKKIILVSVLVVCLSMLLGRNVLHAESQIYDRIGIIPEHGFHGAVPEENIDLFTGNLTLRFLDIYLPGPNGFDLKLWRVYNSKILRDRMPGQAWQMQQEPYSWVGMGWSMHMGRIHDFNSNTPAIEFPDGRWETAYLKTDGSCYVTRDFLKYDKAQRKLYFKDGTVWTFGETRTIVHLNYVEQVLVVTRIENSFGHHIDVFYETGLPTIDRIKDSMGREINFVTSASTSPTLREIRVLNAHGSTAWYYYTVDRFAHGGYYKLTAYDPPELQEATYEYNEGYGDHYELTAVNTSFGGRMEYEYDAHTFYFQVQPLETQVLVQKRISPSSSSATYTWNYEYPSYYGVDSDTVVVYGPRFNTSIEYYAYSSASPWKVGLIRKKSLSDGSYTEGFSWTPRVISSTSWYVMNIYMGKAIAPLVSCIQKIRRGDSDTKEFYYYEREDTKKYGLPTKIELWINESKRESHTIQYFYESNTTFEGKYMLSPISQETYYNSAGYKLKETKTSYFDYSNKCGAVNWIEKWVSGGQYLLWDYNYSSSTPSSITISIDLPGYAGTEIYEYQYGVLAEIDRPGYSHAELSRTISPYDSSILSETNQHNGTMYFSYDDLSRIDYINMPSGFNDINVSWSDNSVTMTQGSQTIIKYWDGLGRDLGYKESGDGISLYFLKTLDAEGRVVAETKGSTVSSQRYSYLLSALGQIRKITDPRGQVTLISYSGDEKTVTDPKGRVTTYEYDSLPGLVTKITDAQYHTGNNIYDALGRLTRSVFNSSRTQSFSYDGVDNLLSEDHPETGTIYYDYDSENNLSYKDWGSTLISYSYNQANQMTAADSGDELIRYSYDLYGRIDEISSSSGWARTSITYNSLGSVTKECQKVPGLAAKYISYKHDSNNNLSSIIYPDGRTVSYTNNGLRMPETISFSGKSLVKQVSYGYNKQPTAIAFSGNSTTFSASYNSVGALSSASLKKGTVVLYRAAYQYDEVGNIALISNTVPAMNIDLDYDKLDRLTSAVYSQGAVKNFSYNYDEYGNLELAREDAKTVFNAGIDSNNQIAAYAYDHRGNLTSASPYSYVWDNKNRLKKILNKGVLYGSFLYDERGCRIRSIRASAAQATSLQLLSPNGGEKLVAGENEKIAWISETGTGKIAIEYSTDQGRTFHAIAPKAENNGSFLWRVPNSPSNQCLVKLSKDKDGLIDISDSLFSIVEVAQPEIFLDRKNLCFGSNRTGLSTPAQTIKICRRDNKTVTWNVVADSAWLRCQPIAGQNDGVVSVSVHSKGLASGTYLGHIWIASPEAGNSPQQVEVELKIQEKSAPPFGSFDTPEDGGICQGPIAVSGWTLDDIKIERVEIKRDPLPQDSAEKIGKDNLVHLGSRFH